MQDIGIMLNSIMEKEQCTPLCALFILSEKEGDKDVRTVQPESVTKTGRRLRDKGNL